MVTSRTVMDAQKSVKSKMDGHVKVSSRLKETTLPPSVLKTMKTLSQHHQLEELWLSQQ